MQCVLDIIRQKMLSTNVLCMKKRKKRSYYISEASDYIPRPSKDKRSLGNNTAMMQITEDTPPDMLAGAMDLIIHLPNSRTVKMSVERSTPMMDLLMQITTANHLQHSGHILQALEMGSASGPTDKILPYKPNTPIGSLDTQHVKVVPKNRTNSVPKTLAIGHQPFESTFRLQVHLPRNQLYVIRVSQFVYLEDIMKKVCDEKNLDIRKYEFRHPGNLDEVLDPKLTLSDYQVTEVYLVSKGTVGLTQTFSSSDIMALKKEEERKQLQARTGGGVFSLIFKRGKPSFGSGSVSSDNRSISPSHSDDSRSVTPPGIQQQILPVTQQPSPITEKPKPPQRKRRPAPKPPQPSPQKSSPDSKPSSQISTISDSNTSDLQHKNNDNGLTICHSRNSSDSSGYHEPSVLSDNCNLSLPRRPKSNIINEVVNEESQLSENTKSSGNLSNMVMFSKSTTSITSRKKKAAPPPPSVLNSESLVENHEKPSPVVASPVVEAQGECKEIDITVHSNESKTEVVALESVEETFTDPNETDLDSVISNSIISVKEVSVPEVENDEKTFPTPMPRTKKEKKLSTPQFESNPVVLDKTISQAHNNTTHSEDVDVEVELEVVNQGLKITYNKEEYNNNNDQIPIDTNADNTNMSMVPENIENKRAPEIVAVIPKKTGNSPFHSIGLKRAFKVRGSLHSLNNMFNSNVDNDQQLANSKSTGNIPNILDEYEVNDINMDIFKSNTVRKPKMVRQKKVSQQQYGIFDLDLDLNANSSVPSFSEGTNIKRWNNIHDLDDISLISFNSGLGGNRWVMGGDSDTDSISTIQTAPLKESPRESISSSKESSSLCSKPEIHQINQNSSNEEITNSLLQRITESETAGTPNATSQENTETKSVSASSALEEDIPSNKYSKEDFIETDPELESEWQYQLPSPPTAFRDFSPTNLTDVTNYDTITLEGFKEESVITNPMLFEKLERVKDHQYEIDTISDITSVVSEDDKPMLSKLTLENLEKRKSLVYNRELSTSLKIAQENGYTNSNNQREESISKHSNVINELEDVIHNGGNKSLSRHNSCTNDFNSSFDKHLPNFQISTYNKPKNKINIFEDDSIRSNVENSAKDEGINTQITNNSLTEDHIFKKPQEFSKFKVPAKSNFYAKLHSTSNSVIRSESFSSNNPMCSWKPQNPVQRSKSQIALNNYRDDKSICEINDGSMSKSNSLFDVSGLQSLEVMRIIQTKLSTPTSSSEQLLEKEQNTNKKIADEISVDPVSTETDKSDSKTNSKTYKYQGPPAINLSTWSERPKTKVSLKEDKDYRSNETVISNNNSSVLINNNNVERTDNCNGVSIKVNGIEPTRTTTQSGNIVIKIGESEPTKNTFSSRFINHTTAPAYRKPLSNVNKIGNIVRPHSIALDNDFDISRVPIVRSVELKKPFKETVQINNKSITQINSNNSEIANNIRNKYIEKGSNSDSIKQPNSDLSSANVYGGPEPFVKPIARVNSFAQNRPVPTVMGFRSIENGNDNTARSRKSWNVPNSYSTLPIKANLDTTNRNMYTPNSNVPFSQVTLRRVESNKLFTDNSINSNGHVNNSSLTNRTSFNRLSSEGSLPNLNDFSIQKSSYANSSFVPPPPAMPKITNIKKKSIKSFEPVKDPRDELLNSIRNFGGTKGLKHVKG